MSAPDDPEVTRRDLANEDQPTVRAVSPLTPLTPSGSTFGSGGARFAPGTIIADRFRIVNLVGAGGMGEVYRAEDLRLGQTVALKFVSPEIAHQEQVIAMLHREVRLGREVSHPNVARLYDVFDWESFTFVSMEFIDGENLSSLLRRIGRLPHDKGVEIGRGIARGLAAAHDRGVLHRDLKPANIMIDGRGEAKITDFGLAVAGDEQNPGTAGTPMYMAPELLMGEPATERSDVYALGVVLYELFTGRRARSGRSAAEILREHAEPPSAPSSFQPDIDRQVEQVILRCLEPEPEDRPASAREVVGALPGGDRLAAAIAAGETPSPDAVVAADVQGRLSVSQAALLVTGLIALSVILLYFKELGSAPALTDWSRPPLVLEDRARGILGQLGLEVPPHHDLVMDVDPSIIAWLSQTDPSRDRWDRLAHLPYYTVRWRGAREPIATASDAALGAPPARFANEIEFDLQGRVRELVLREDSRPLDEVSIIELTGLENLQPVEPLLSPPLDLDQQKAWLGRRAEASIDERLEVGFRNGAPVWMQMQGPWEESRTELGELPFATRALETFLLITGLLVLAAAGFFAWRNTRLGRGDRAGAFRLAVFTAILTVTSLLIGATWPPWLGDRIWILRQSLKDALYSGALIYVLYLALEPLVRRTWPALLISWRRLLDGRWRDTLVGRDVLIGCVGGVAHSVLATGTWLTSMLRGEPASTAGVGYLPALLSTRAAIETLGLSVNFAIFFALAIVFVISVFAVLTRRRWAAVALMILLMNVAFFFAIGGIRWVSVLIAIVTIGVTARYGLLAAVVMHFFFTTTFHYPILFDSSRWFFWTAILPMLILAVLTFLAVRAATGHASTRRQMTSS